MKFREIVIKYATQIEPFVLPKQLYTLAESSVYKQAELPSAEPALSFRIQQRKVTNRPTQIKKS